MEEETRNEEEGNTLRTKKHSRNRKGSRGGWGNTPPHTHTLTIEDGIGDTPAQKAQPKSRLGDKTQKARSSTLATLRECTTETREQVVHHTHTHSLSHTPLATATQSCSVFFSTCTLHGMHTNSCVSRFETSHFLPFLVESNGGMGQEFCIVCTIMFSESHAKKQK